MWQETFLKYLNPITISLRRYSHGYCIQEYFPRITTGVHNLDAQWFYANFYEMCLEEVYIKIWNNYVIKYDILLYLFSNGELQKL